MGLVMNGGRLAGIAALLAAIACDAGKPQSATPGSASAAASVPKPRASHTAAARAQQAPKPRMRRWKMLADMWLYPNPIPNFALTDQSGKTFKLRTLANSYVLVGFIFTTCGNPRACPLTTQKMHTVGKLWKQAERKGKTRKRKLHLLSLTIDPENDTPAALASYSHLLRRDFPAWTFATGPEDLMTEALPRMFGVVARKGAKGEIEHTVKVALLRPGLRSMKEWTNNRFEPRDVVKLVIR